MENPPDWDLLAVVRSCCSTTTTTSSISTPDLEPSIPPPPPSSNSSSSTSSVLFHFPNNPFESCPLTTSFLCGQKDLQDVCKPPVICSTTSTNNINNNMHSNSFQSPVSSPSSVITPRSLGVFEQQQQFRGLIKPSQVIFRATTPSIATTPIGVTNSSHVQRTKKRKNLMKKVCHVPAEGLSSDMWAWRKYGQKPIKGSPYPRGYYRCSSSKGCLARKQVERNRSDPKMFIVTYTAEHNHPMPTHRNSLAGSTRQKPLTTVGTPPEQPTCSSPSAASLSPLTEKSESKTDVDDIMKEEDDTNEMGLSDLILNDDFYVGFEQIDGGSDGSDCLSDQFSPSSDFPWLVNSSSTATAAGGS
ncbi:WRKY transcription factor 22 [Amaranthus tricolor]|uniref:WRKY transcription factor 22 n=1 Tax=Amaranthus tricolor TaxID=29722 RepID=UPI00258DE2FD|nr:WRKY transcription factor 22 [Amaranthus tricolor]